MRNRPTPEAPIADGRLGIDRAVDVGQQFQLDAVGGPAGWSRFVGQLILEQEELALQLEIGAALLGVGIDQHVPAAAVDDDRVAGLHLPQDAAHARDGRDAAAAGDDGGVAGLAAGLRDDAADVDVAQGDGLRGEQFVGHDDHRARTVLLFIGHLTEQGDPKPDDHVADVVQSFFQVFVVGAGEEGVYSSSSGAGRPGRSAGRRRSSRGPCW